MHLSVYTIGKPKLLFAKHGVEEYLKRLKRYGKVEWKTLKEESSRDLESKKLFEVSEKSFRIVLDERGDMLSTQQWVKLVEDLELRSTQKLSILIGGANGHSPDFLKKADRLISLSPLTLQHELALVVFLEQMYRVQTIKRGEPYHRE